MTQLQAVRDTFVPTNMEESPQEATELSPSVRDNWLACLSLLKERLPWQTVQTWLLPIVPVSFHQDTLLLRVTSSFISEWVESNYGEELKRAVAQTFGLGVEIDFSIAPEPAEREPAEIPISPEGPSSSNPSARQAIIQECDVNHAFTFEGFVYGPETEFSFKVAQYIAQNRVVPKYSPLVVYGDVGTGKSHLLHAIANQVLSSFPETRLYIGSAVQFLNSYVAAAVEGSIAQLNTLLTSFDIFILEDIHTLAGKEKSQENLHFVLSQLIMRNHQVILSANLPPNRLKMFSEGLVSLMHKGLIVDLPMAQMSTRERIIRSVLKAQEVSLSEEVIYYLAEHISENLHQLHSTLIRIIAQASMMNSPIDLAEVKRILANLNIHGGVDQVLPYFRKEPGIDEIVKATAEVFKLPTDVIRGGSRKKRIALARQVAIYLCRELTDESLTCIGYHFSNRHHATILHARDKIMAEIRTNPTLRNAVEKIKSLI